MSELKRNCSVLISGLTRWQADALLAQCEYDLVAEHINTQLDYWSSRKQRRVGEPFQHVKSRAKIVKCTGSKKKADFNV